MSSLPDLLSAARSDDPTLRQHAAMQLGVHGTDEVVDELVDLMVAEPDDFVRETLIWAVVARRSAGVPRLMALLDDPSVDAERVLHTLSKIEDPSTIEAISRFVDDPDAVVAAKAQWALGRIGDPTTLPLLLDQLGTTAGEPRQALTRALVQFGAAAVGPLVDALEAPTSAGREHAVEVLVRLTDPDSYGIQARRAGAIEDGMAAAKQALVTATAPEVGSVLGRLLEDSDRPRLADVARDLMQLRSA